MPYPNLQRPGTIESLEIKNRVVMTAASCSLASLDGRATENLLAYYDRRAQGGVGLIITEMTCVDETYGILVPGSLSAARDESVTELKKLPERIHPHGTRIFAQLIHPGHNADSRLNRTPLLSASPVKGKYGKADAREATPEEIHTIAHQFGMAARRLKQSGFDGVEIHGAHHYLIHSFLSPVTNRRTDEFGGDLSNRARFLHLIMESVRQQCGRDFPVMVRISLEEYIGKQGYHADTGIKICQMLENWGASAINVSASGTASKLSQSVEPMAFMQGWRRHLARAVKKTVSIPVCTVALVRDPAFAESLITEGYTDFVGSARSHLADPDWTKKAFQGRDTDINRCIGCMSCFEMYPQEKHITCAICPETGYEAEYPPMVRDGAGKTVLVLGAGPGGMESALVAARRGFSVTVYEKKDQPGGQLLLASLPPRKEKIKWLIDYLYEQCLKARVKFLFNTCPSMEELQAKKPHAILDATGGTSIIPSSIEGADTSPLVCTPEHALVHNREICGESIVIVGSGMTGLETAEILCEREKNNAIVIMEAASRIAPGAHGSNRNCVSAVLDINNVVFMLNRTLTRIGADRIWFCDTNTKEEFVYPCDRVVLALGIRPVNPYKEALQEICPIVHQVGDARKSGKIWHAVHDAYLVACSL